MTSATGSPARMQFKVENRKGNTNILLNRAGETTTIEIAAVHEDDTVRYIDVTPYLARRDDEITMHSQIDKYGIFGTSRRDAKVTPIVDGQNSPAWSPKGRAAPPRGLSVHFTSGVQLWRLSG